MLLENVTIGAATWEKDFSTILGTRYFELLFHSNLDCKRLLIINNIKERESIEDLLRNIPTDKLKMDIIWGETTTDEVLKGFPGKKITRKSFITYTPIKKYIKSFFSNKRLKLKYDGFWYSIGPLTAIYKCNTKYLLYFTGDAHIENDKDFEWINEAIDIMEKDNSVISASPVWNNLFDSAKAQSLGNYGNFYINNTFSDQCFLIDVERVKSIKNFFNQKNKSVKIQYPIYASSRSFECRVCSYLRNNNLKRIVYKNSSYIHEDFTESVIKKYAEEKR